MTESNKAESMNAKTSEILDGEYALTDASLSQLDSEKFSNYALIGDVIRAKNDNALTIDITSNIAAALADEPCHNSNNELNEQLNTHQTDNIVSLNRWKTGFSQIAIAASVALVAVLGVNTMQQSPKVMNEPGILQSTPFAGGVSPVSLSSEGNALQSAQKGLRELQQQRIGALVQEHKRQSRMVHALHQTTQEDTDTGKDLNK